MEPGATLMIDDADRRLIAALESGLGFEPRPYATLGVRAGLEEADVIARLRRMIDAGIIKRLGVIVRHHELGYRANAMVVWDVPDAEVAAVGRRLAGQDAVTLCYQRPRRLPHWPYNLFCMIHGRQRDEVLNHLGRLIEDCGLGHVEHRVLFSKRRFKQRGARRLSAGGTAAVAAPS